MNKSGRKMVSNFYFNFVIKFYRGKLKLRFSEWKNEWKKNNFPEHSEKLFT